jgi:transcriptional regulator of acetoin/glycerol metabolism
VADLVEPARLTTLDQFDEATKGLAIATAWLRSKAAHDRDPAAPETAPLWPHRVYGPDN